MGVDTVNEPLLSSENSSQYYGKKKPFFISIAKWVLKTVMWVLFIIWVGIMFLYPTDIMSNLFEKWIQTTDGTIYGITGSLFLAFSGPVLIIVFLAVLYLFISREEKVEEGKTTKHPGFCLWTFPVLVDGPFGVVCATEFIGILLFIMFIIWEVSAYTVKNWQLLSQYDLSSFLRSTLMLELTGLRFGFIGLLCLAFLFLPIARGSVLLRLIDIPFEHATRYHVWLGHLTMALFTLHGAFYIIAWTLQGRLLHEILEWRDIGVANLAGVISLTAGLLMWVTSLKPVRKAYFELFFYTHQLYTVFVIFLALHVGDFIFSIAAGGIFLFMLDRFLRFCQSRKTVEIISARSFPCGTVELVLSKPANLGYNALSFIFVQVRELSWLQWHPFSVSSSPLDGKYHLSVLIKVLGEWTAKLRGLIPDLHTEDQNILQTGRQSQITASVEGPYGHESSYHLKYKYLILVAGGIGISPFLAVLSDILHRIEEGRPCMPGHIVVVWAIKRSNELPLLTTLDMESIAPFLSNVLNLEFQIYITQESEPSLEEGKTYKAVSSPLRPISKRSAMSVLVGTGDKFWSGLYIISSVIGFLIILGLLDMYYINPYEISTWWYKGLLFLGCMFASVIIFGGFVVILWRLWEAKTLASEEPDFDRKNNNGVRRDKPEEHTNVNGNGHVSLSNICYGCRPNFKDIFGVIAEQWGCVDAGVLACGPPSLVSSVAKEIRSRNLRGKRHHPVFHFHTHSFEL
ncbi:hypothetical protein Ancab_003297 [Ancistrocladus abbreviatus]